MATSLLLVPAVATGIARPNIVFVLTDDQDQMLGGSFPPAHDGATPMPKTRSLLADEGVTATNFFVHTPICCPSRSELLAGRYLHNLKVHPGAPPPPKNGVCMHVNTSKILNYTFAAPLRDAGYRVGLFGKFLNNWPGSWGHPPDGFDAWMANGGGEYFSPGFGVANLDFAGIANASYRRFHGAYTTALVGNISTAWIRHVRRTTPDAPFFAYIAPKAAHEPFNPAPWYVDTWEAHWPAHEPRPRGVWNASYESRRRHHGNIATQPLLTPDAAAVISGVFRNRWRCLLSVDDLIAEVVSTVEDEGALASTYFAFTSDHGFQLGEFNMLMDKRHVYDFDTRVHLLVRGPGVPRGVELPFAATFVDLAPTFLDLARVDVPARMDGRSLRPLLEGDADAARAWRNEVYLEYYYVADNDKCVRNCSRAHEGDYPQTDSPCVDLARHGGCWGPPACNEECYATESPANNFRALRQLGRSAGVGTGGVHAVVELDVEGTREAAAAAVDAGAFDSKAAAGGAAALDASSDFLYAEFATGQQDEHDVTFDPPDFHELYDMAADPWSLHNVYGTAPNATRDALRARLRRWFECAGKDCP